MNERIGEGRNDYEARKPRSHLNLHVLCCYFSGFSSVFFLFVCGEWVLNPPFDRSAHEHRRASRSSDKPIRDLSRAFPAIPTYISKPGQSKTNQRTTGSVQPLLAFFFFSFFSSLRRIKNQPAMMERSEGDNYYSIAGFGDIYTYACVDIDSHSKYAHSAHIDPSPISRSRPAIQLG